ncbi:hypothetical protein COT97_02840 [Candidatus Falkowbacteria bacterium CG10_big_fil_rev_8_21_14_0_10_39_11]|uniref:Uncharacterized protein n=1 Tax=Candidatus Falkowbacteria bacterium CG10_big_fil_rev_8_21_14_0_10_39_11 TaxID=1974565 RepID=A0A2H0V4W8_9BACT|nr:MAG: hypothetical protein COT97_02840 [Candidatus Falkowbacteria bacterium CG10_big_fil_rev_8_21_14_0_10_39_11]
MRQPGGNKGQTLIEVIVVVALFFLLVTGTVMLSGRYFNGLLYAQELAAVQIYVDQTYAIIDSMAQEDWTNMAVGQYGLIYSGGIWSFGGSSDIIKSKYTRQVSVAAVQRDDNCQVVFSGGIEDPDTKMIAVQFAWNGVTGNKNESFSRYLTHWQAPERTCVEAQAGNLVLNIDNSSIDATRKSIVGTVLSNEGVISITIDKMIITWTEPGNMVFIKIDGTNYWHATSGVGLPIGSQPSGTEIDIVDFVLEPGLSYDIDNIRFDSKVDGSEVTITAVMGDGSTKTEVTTPPFIP